MDWNKLKVVRGKGNDLRAALDDLAESDDAAKDLALMRIHERLVDTGPVLTGSAAVGPLALALIPKLAPKYGARLATTIVHSLCAGDAAAESLGIPSVSAHAARYGKGAGKELHAAVTAAIAPGLALAAAKQVDERRAGVLLLAYVADAKPRDKRLLELASGDRDPWLRAAAAYALAIHARRGGAGVADEIVAEIERKLDKVAAPLVAAIRLVRDGEATSDAVLAACGPTPKLNVTMNDAGDPFPFGGVGALGRATATALDAIGPRGETRRRAIDAANVAAFNKIMGRS